jgi:hypothetical protein
MFEHEFEQIRECHEWFIRYFMLELGCDSRILDALVVAGMIKYPIGIYIDHLPMRSSPVHPRVATTIIQRAYTPYRNAYNLGCVFCFAPDCDVPDVYRVGWWRGVYVNQELTQYIIQTQELPANTQTMYVQTTAQLKIESRPPHRDAELANGLSDELI